MELLFLLLAPVLFIAPLMMVTLIAVFLWTLLFGIPSFLLDDDD